MRKFGVAVPATCAAAAVVGLLFAASPVLAQRAQEALVTPTWHLLNTITEGISWKEDFNALREEILAKGLTQDVPAARAFFDQAEDEHKKRSNCGQPNEAPACKVETRYIYEVFRSTPKELVFAQALFGFELASADPRVVAINLVGEEDEHTSMTDYADHMRIIGYLRALYPKVRVSLHAGELAPGLVPPEGLCCHIRLAVEQAKADRIGHGVDVMYEDRPYELMKDMAARRVLVEINLTSNDLILGIKGKRHPSLYRRFGVPVALSTDDEGIASTSRTSMCAPWRPRISAMRTSSTWCATVSNTASCRA